MAHLLEQLYELVPVASLRWHPANPRKGDLPAIGASIRANGFYGAVVAQRGTRYVLAGNHRWEAAKRERMELVPVIWLDVDEAAARRILAADNRTNDLAGYDETALAELLRQIQADGELAGSGYDEAAYREAMAAAGLAGEPEAEEPGAIDAGRAEEVRARWKTEPGQLWAMKSPRTRREHRLLCGDSTSGADIGRLLTGARPVLLATDPPYGVRYDSAWREGVSSGQYASGTIRNDDRADWGEVWERWQTPVLYVWHSGLHGDTVKRSIEAAGFDVRAQIIWHKTAPVLSRGAYHWQHEPCWYAVRRGANANWRGDRSQTTVWTCGNGSGAARTGDPADAFHAEHPSQKPVELFRRPMQNHTEAGDLVAEPFAGSGSQFVAAEQLGRVCAGMEVDPVHVAMILERMTGMGVEARLLG